MKIVSCSSVAMSDKESLLPNGEDLAASTSGQTLLLSETDREGMNITGGSYFRLNKCTKIKS